jgi:methionyl aminopeptidase
MVYRKSASEIALMAEGGKIVAKVLKRMEEVVRPGITTGHIEKEAERLAKYHGVVPAFKGYSGYPSAICVSVNEEVVHGIPSGRRSLSEGDIVSLDYGAFYKGFYSDAAVTLPVGKIDNGAKRLLEVTRNALMRGIQVAVEGNRVGDIANTIQRFVEGNGFSVVKVFVGHGIGKNLHEEPQVPNFGEPQWGIRLKEGMTVAIEPMVNAGGDEVRVLDDGWTAVTSDGSLSAHFEHTIAVTRDGPRILTMDSPAGEESWS